MKASVTTVCWAAVLTVTVALLGARGAVSCQPPHCDRVSMGECGNACCLLKFTFEKESTTQIKEGILNVLGNGGPDGQYLVSTTAEGDYGFSDLRKFNASVDYIGQAIHSTKVHHYNDSIDMTISSLPQGSYLTAFSISQIAGAFGDAGQNYKVPSAARPVRGPPSLASSRFPLIHFF